MPGIVPVILEGDLKLTNTRKTFRHGDLVFVGTAKSIPVRYQGRSATVVGKQKVGKSYKFLLDFGSRRATPLPVSPTQLTLAP